MPALLAAMVLPASAHDNKATEDVLAVLDEWGSRDRLELVLVDRGVTERGAAKLGAAVSAEVRRVGWEDKSSTFRPIKHAWRVEVAHGRIGRSRRLAKSFENTTMSATGWLQVACLMLVLRGSS